MRGNKCFVSKCHRPAVIAKLHFKYYCSIRMYKITVFYFRSDIKLITFQVTLIIKGSRYITNLNYGYTKQ